jgi:protein-S-isoprenylcysteine O-methyltransferase Ste14
MALSRQGLAFTVVPVVLIVATLVFMRPVRLDAIRVAGLVLAIAGFALLTIARAQLGTSFSVRPQARGLVTTGLYSRIRHPIYVFGTLCLDGVALLVGMPKLLLLFVVLLPVQVMRMRAEGSALEDKFGDDYRAWKRQTWF